MRLEDMLSEGPSLERSCSCWRSRFLCCVGGLFRAGVQAVLTEHAWNEERVSGHRRGWTIRTSTSIHHDFEPVEVGLTRYNRMVVVLVEHEWVNVNRFWID